ncbi:phosphomevalonate kinase [Sporobolomyces koalae]|uniref:phosphomevalonate kinase n=1 Tax=Sporobolomyces koalae TaxID=500713 RepID=UPI00317960D5
MVNTQSIVVSCPGKVLVAGGYLVLDRAHQGFVISTPSRFYTVVQEQEQSGTVPSPATDSNKTEERVKLSVRSPQFDDGVWEYEATKRDVEWTVAQNDSHGSSNSFVHLSLQATLQVATALAQSTPVRDLVITIVGSNDFYSQARDGTEPIPFAPLNCTIRNVHKTGLGSSAAMVTSLTSALFLHWSRTPETEVLPTGTVQLMHNLAQYVHSLAQGKIGSGFDVSAAVYGSQVYRRFDVKCLGDLLEREDQVAARTLVTTLSPIENDMWTAQDSSAEASPFSLPPHLTLLLADVDAGSNTPSMVGKVMAWKKADPAGSNRVWQNLSRGNERLRDVFAALRNEWQADHAKYDAQIDELSQLPASNWSPGPFADSVAAILEIRALMREMGEASGVPIEPPSQTKLLDAVSAIEGVVGAGVPGAGGYDAIWVLCTTPTESVSGPTPLEKVERLLASWKEMSVKPLSRNAWVEGSGSAESERGLVREKLEAVTGLAQAVERGRTQKIE